MLSAKKHSTFLQIKIHLMAVRIQKQEISNSSIWGGEWEKALV